MRFSFGEGWGYETNPCCAAELVDRSTDSWSLEISDHVHAPIKVDSFPPFDEWGDIDWSDEKARLDNVAIYWEKEPRNIIYLVVFAGKTPVLARQEPEVFERRSIL